jgi:hypothetical protein
MSLFGCEPSAEPRPDAAGHALDELLNCARRYSSTKEYLAFMRFVSRFRFYSPYNAMLVHIQMPGATFVAPPHRWRNDYGRLVKPGSHPLVILQPGGPVMFVFDVSDTEPEPEAPDLPKEVTQPFEVYQGRVYAELEMTIENAKRDGVAVSVQDAGSQRAGSIEPTTAKRLLSVVAKSRPKPENVLVPLRYELLLNEKHSREALYATLVHELAHLYCGHLGSPNENWWPDRRRRKRAEEEFEAESVSYLVCRRLGIDSPSGSYLGGYLRGHDEIPVISLDSIMKAAGLIEQMGRGRLPPRKEKDTKQ